MYCERYFCMYQKINKKRGKEIERDKQILIILQWQLFILNFLFCGTIFMKWTKQNIAALKFMVTQCIKTWKIKPEKYLSFHCR